MTQTAVQALQRANVETSPFAHALIPQWWDAEQADALLHWFETEAEWELHERSFYTQHSCRSVSQLREGPLSFLFDASTMKDIITNLNAMFSLDLDEHEIHVEAHRLLPGEGIGLHNDNPLLCTEVLRIVSHFNSAHEDRFGGHLVLFASNDPSDITTVIRPLHNSAVMFPLGPLSFHAVTDVRDGVRYSLVLGFFERGRVPLMHRIQLRETGGESAALSALVPDLATIGAQLRQWGAADTAHGEGTLWDHLHATAGLLARWRAPVHVCRAGLVHSVYGTQSIDAPLLTDSDRTQVADAVGSDAERLVWAYCRLKFGDVFPDPDGEGYRARARDGTLVTLSHEDLVSLNLMAWANQLSGGVEVELEHDAWVDFSEVVDKLAPWLPPECLDDLHVLRTASSE
jgi:hypothetical protein